MAPCVNVPHLKPEEPAIDLTGKETKGEANESYWVIIEDNKLRKEDRPILDSRFHKWLIDNHVSAAQLLLRRQHPHILGLEPHVLQFTHTFSVHKGKQFIKIFNVSGNHWITVSTVGCPPGTITVYGSLNLSLTTLTVADLMLHGGKKITIQHIHVHFQTGTSDCGLFAIAKATVLTNGLDPNDLRFHQKLMRNHLRESFEKQTLNMFPSKQLLQEVQLQF